MTDQPHDKPRDPCPTAAGSVSCQTCVEFLMDYLDGVLPADQRFRFDSHLAFCPDCKNYLDNYRQAISLAGEAGQEARAELDANIPPDLIKAILAARKAGK